MKSYLFVYSYNNNMGFGFGNAPIKADYDVYIADNIRKIEGDIAKNMNYDSVAILNIIPLND